MWGLVLIAVFDGGDGGVGVLAPVRGTRRTLRVREGEGRGNL